MLLEGLEEFYSTIGLDVGQNVIELYSVKDDGTCTCGKLSCTSPGKHPKNIKWKTKDFLREKNVKKEEIKYYTDLIQQKVFNFGIVCGKSKAGNKSIVVLDFDDIESEKELIEKLREEKTLEIKTGKGLHFYFFGTVESKIKAQGKKLDILCNNRYVVGPGSVHSSGKRYEILEVNTVKELPVWFYEQFYVEKVQDFNSRDDSRPKKLQSKTVVNKINNIEIGKRNTVLFNTLIKVANESGFNLKTITSAANILWEKMEDNISFSSAELEQTIASVMRYKTTSSEFEHKHKTFSFDKPSEMWVKRLNNLGVVSFVDIKQNDLFGKFESLERYVFDNSIVSKSLSEDFTGNTVSDFINQRNKLMTAFFEGVPAWNFLNCEHTEWAVIFNEKFDKRRYRGVKYFGKGNARKEKIGFGFSFANFDKVLAQLNKVFGSLKELMIGFFSERKGPIKKFDSEIDLRFLKFFAISEEKIELVKKASKTNMLFWSDLKQSNIKLANKQLMVLTCAAPSTTVGHTQCNWSKQQMSTLIKREKAPSEDKLVFEKKVKITEHPKAENYPGFKGAVYSELSMKYIIDNESSGIDDDTLHSEGYLADKQKVVDFLNTLKEGDVVGVGYRHLYFKAFDDDDDYNQVLFYRNFQLEEAKVTELDKSSRSEVLVPFSLINKYLDLGLIEILYRDGDLFGISEEEKYKTYKVYDVSKKEEVEEPKQEEKSEEV